MPHNGVCVGDNIQLPPIGTQPPQRFQPVARNPRYESIECLVDLCVANSMWDMAAHLCAELLNRYLTLFDKQEWPLLPVIAKIVGNIGKTKLFESFHTILAADVDNNPAQVKQQRVIFIYHHRKQ